MANRKAFVKSRALEVRSTVETTIRHFFNSLGFQEVRTPILVPSPGLEPHIRPIEAKRPKGLPRYLHTSPEFAMKKLLLRGMEKIYQICPTFREEPISETHLPEFTLLEWYRVGTDHYTVMEDVEGLFESIAQAIHGHTVIRYQGESIDLERPWPRRRVEDLFKEYLDVDLLAVNLGDVIRRLGLAFNDSDTWDDQFFKVWLNAIEPKFPKNRPLIVEDYPKSQAAFSEVENGWAKRFEVYVGGLELGNAFKELRSADEFKTRFGEEMNLRNKIYGDSFPANVFDTELYQMMKENGFPECGGIAMGVDRMVMLFSDETDIRNTLWISGNLREDRH